MQPVFSDEWCNSVRIGPIYATTVVIIKSPTSNSLINNSPINNSPINNSMGAGS
jgi:hypothetical protein